MANILANQYSKVFSTPQENTDNTNPIHEIHTKPYQKLDISEEELLKAINELSASAAAGPDEFPAILLKNCKHELVKPLCKLWDASFHHGIVPSKLKNCIITPTYKGGSKADATIIALLL